MEKIGPANFIERRYWKCRHTKEKALPAWELQTDSNPPPADAIYLESSGIGFSFHLSGMKICSLSAIISSVENVHCLNIKNVSTLEVDFSISWPWRQIEELCCCFCFVLLYFFLPSTYILKYVLSWHPWDWGGHIRSSWDHLIGAVCLAFIGGSQGISQGGDRYEVFLQPEPCPSQYRVIARTSMQYWFE